MIYCVLYARRRRKQACIFLVNAVLQPIQPGCISGLLFVEPRDLKQAHWITLSRFAKTSKAWYTLATKSTVVKTGVKSATKLTESPIRSTVANTVDFIAGFGDKSATT